ncbi:hypothetical protein [Leptospira interrogans]|nr:hypothetical protein [Leptospira interrogans]EMN10983.1 hypothetical protein LEP1GSC053_1594 [Leptospira interrogans serovar Muenchen str. Brem 129]
MGHVVEWELSFIEDFVVIPTIDLEIQLFVGWLWLSPMFLVSIPSAILLHKTILS